jgi:hypothetical protein
MEKHGGELRPKSVIGRDEIGKMNSSDACDPGEIRCDTVFHQYISVEASLWVVFAMLSEECP